MAIDLGDARTGLATGDTVTMLVSPAGTLEVSIKAAGGDELLRAIAKAVALHGPGTLIIGLPLNMDGTEGPRAKSVRAFSQRIAELTKLPIAFQDERLTTAQADWDMARSGLTRGQKKAKRDQIAAATLLTDHFKAIARAQGGLPPDGTDTGGSVADQGQ